MKFLRALYYSTTTFIYAVLTFVCGAMVFGLVLGFLTGQQSWTGYNLIRLCLLSLAGYVLWRITIKRWNQAQPSSAARTPIAELGRGEFYSRVTGTTFTNPNGTDRQQAIRQHCTSGAPLRLVREPDNEFDAAAIAVYCEGAQIGYLPSHLTNEYAADIDAGHIEMSARVKEVTGGSGNKPSLGVNIIVRIKER